MKKWISLILTIGICLGLFSSCEAPIEETSTNIDDPDFTDISGNEIVPVLAYEDYAYHKFEFGEGYKTAPRLDLDGTGYKLSWSSYTPEYLYYTAMYDLSNYVSIIDHYLKNQTADAEDLLLSKYFESYSMNNYVEYYDALMLNAVELLHKRGFKPAELSSVDILNFMGQQSYCVWGKERYTILALGIMGYENLFLSVVNKLLAFEQLYTELYPNGGYQYALDKSDKKLMQGIKKAAEAIGERSNELHVQWAVYYAHSLTGLNVSVMEEYILEKDVMKITIQSESKCIPSLIPNQYIENLAHTVSESGLVASPKEALTSPVVIYLPLAYYNKYGAFKLPDLHIETYNDANESHCEDYRLQLDPHGYYSEETVTLPDAFLHSIMTKLFGSNYSEKDLSYVTTIVFYQFADGSLTLRVTYSTDAVNNTVKEYDYEKLMGTKPPASMTAEMQESLTYFRGLFSASGNRGYAIPSEIWDMIKPYSIAEEWRDRLYGKK